MEVLRKATHASSARAERSRQAFKKRLEELGLDDRQDGKRPRLLLAPVPADAMSCPVADVGIEHVVHARSESARRAQRLDELRMELLQRSHLQEEAERIRREAELAKAKAAEEARAAAQERERLEREKEAAEQARKQAEQLRQEALEAEAAAKLAAQRTSKDLVLEALARRQQFLDRKSQIAGFSKKFKKPVGGCRMMLQMTSETVKALSLGLEGNGKVSGAQSFLSELRMKRPDLLEHGMHVVAETLLLLGSTNVAPDCIKHGETKFALVYIVVVLSITFAKEGFYTVFQQALNAMCPYSVPGLRDAIVEAQAAGASRDAQREALGYMNQESNADYIARMQAMVGFQAGVLQTPVKFLEELNLVPAGSRHPSAIGGVVEIWQWLALTMNRPAGRWTPYLIQAVLAVAGNTIVKHCGAQAKKLLSVLASDAFVERCRAVGVFDSSKEDNDLDRMNAYTQFFKSLVGERAFDFPPPGRDGVDARQLVFDVTQNN